MESLRPLGFIDLLGKAEEKNMSENGKTGGRQSNLELFRILTMILIIAHHYVIRSGLSAQDGPISADPTSLHALLTLFFGAFGKTGINCFVLITGYFMCEKNISARKFLRLLAEVMFYQIVILGIFWITGREKPTVDNILNYFLPVRELNDGFVGAFLVFFLCIPFLNVLVHHMSEKQHVRLMALLGFTYIFLGTFRPVFDVDMNYATWFCVLYIVASYIRLYPKKCFDSVKRWGWIAFACASVSMLSVAACAFAATRIGKPVYYWFVTDCNTLLAVLTAVSSFLFFKNLRIPQSRIINTIAGTTFGVLLIHGHGNAMCRLLWYDILDGIGNYSSPIRYIHPILSVFGVFAVCAAIDLLRIQLIEKPFLRWADKKLPGITERWQRLEEKFFRKCHIGYSDQ